MPFWKTWAAGRNKDLKKYLKVLRSITELSGAMKTFPYSPLIYTKYRKEEIVCLEMEPSCTTGGNAKGAAVLQSNLVFPQIDKELQYNPAITLLGIYPKETKTCGHTKLLHSVHNSISHNS